MEDEQQRLKAARSHEIGMVLDTLSVSELEHRIGLLEGEIRRLRAAIEARGETLRAAEAAFKI
ncbi:Uncharacterized small protein, DUF1192 family [Devosia crocina]|uniref:Uncharacterized small protein, DUF1192 family n=1 Tax=Devosia crocina TaxID=429728 RepID=A0A1I7MX65_9HYPH|nr:DUF1192 domain-containing protein [Devosia crocina]SFV27001.1 Uncharacterized small protein, DUF1192 family [Devosia crocina]